jgi:hypothetical protein
MDSPILPSGVWSKSPAVFFCAICRKNAGGVSKTDEICLLIATGSVYVDLSAVASSSQEQVPVLANVETAGAYQRTFRDSEPQHVRGQVGARSDQHQMRTVKRFAFWQRLATSSEQDLIIANRRFDLVKRHLEGDRAPNFVSRSHH